MFFVVHLLYPYVFAFIPLMIFQQSKIPASKSINAPLKLEGGLKFFIEITVYGKFFQQKPQKC